MCCVLCVLGDEGTIRTGTRMSMPSCPLTSAVIVCCNLSVIAFILTAGFPLAQLANLSPFLPFGATGMFSAARCRGGVGQEAGGPSQKLVVPSVLLHVHLLLVINSNPFPSATQHRVFWFCRVRWKSLERAPAACIGRCRVREVCGNSRMAWRVLSTSSTPTSLAPRFDYLANAAEEAIDPGRTLPIGLLASLGVATVLYALMSLALVLMVPYLSIDVHAPFSAAFVTRGAAWAGKVRPPVGKRRLLPLS